LAQYLQYVRRKRRALVGASADRGLAAQGRLKGLKVAATYANAPIPSSVLDCTIVTSAARSTESEKAKGDYVMSFALACHLESIALADPNTDDWSKARQDEPKPVVSEFQAHAAQSLLIELHTSSRTASFLRMSLVALIPADNAFRMARLHLRSTDKAPSSAQMEVVDHWCLLYGFTEGMDLWGPRWAARALGKPFICEGVVSKPAHSLAAASAWSGKACTSETITSYLRQLATLERLSQPVAQSKRLLLSARCLRHLYASLAAALQIAESAPSGAQFALGDWKNRKAAHSKSINMPMLYAGSEARLLAGAEARVTIVSSLRDFMGDRPWYVAVPSQQNERPSFGFLFSAVRQAADSDSDDDFAPGAEESSSDDEKDDAVDGASSDDDVNNGEIDGGCGTSIAKPLGRTRAATARTKCLGK
jgi:hypothetical protein